MNWFLNNNHYKKFYKIDNNIKLTFQLSVTIMCDALPDFYSDMSARHTFLWETLSRLYEDINIKVIARKGRNFVYYNFVGQDRVNMRFYEENRNYNGKIVRGVQICIKPEHQTPVKSSKFPYGR